MPDAARTKPLDVHPQRTSSLALRSGKVCKTPNLPFVPEVVGEVDRRHPALTELALDVVVAGEGRVQASNWIGHDPTCGEG